MDKDTKSTDKLKQTISIKKKNNKIHDSIIKEMLDDKEEFIDFMKCFYNIKIDKEKLELQNKEYRTRLGLKTKYIDILYKIKNEETFIILEHQSVVDYIMSERMGEYCLAVVGSRRKYMLRSKNRIAPVVYPIVLSTAKKQWDAPRTIRQNKENLYKIPTQKYPEYEVTDINNYTIDFLLEKRIGITLVMAFEKIRTKEEMIYVINKLKTFGINNREKKAMKLIIEYIEEEMAILCKNLTKKEIENIKKEMIKIIKRKGDFMSNFEKALARIIKEDGKKERNYGISIGKKEGINIGKRETAIEMLKINMKEEDIIRVTHISKEELKKLKLQIV